MYRKSRKQLTVRFLQRTVLFLTTYSAGLALFFLFGNAQDFLDSTQSLILSVLAGTALLTTILALVLSASMLVSFIGKRLKRSLIAFFLGFFCLALVLFLALGSRIIIILSRGM
jgi:hypothetical protein